MKKTILQRVAAMLLLVSATLLQAQAQTPNTFSYQAAVRTASGLPMANKNLVIRVSIKDSAINGALLYRETHNRTTNALGLLEIEVGGGVVQTGTFTSINWGRNSKYLQTEVDTGNGNYLDLGTTQLLSVPTALYAREAGNGVPLGGGDGQVLTRCNGQLVWTSGGQCPVTTPTYPAGTVHCNGTPTTVVEVTNPTTGRIWMDRNLGASQAATSSTDAQAYGDLYQWGRRADGHQCRNSGTTTTLSSTDQPAHGNFIIAPNNPWDWRSPQNNNLWQGVNGVNNPCPTGFRIPTETELNAERTSWTQNNATGAFASPLKLPMAGFRSNSDGSINNVGSYGSYWSSTVDGVGARNLDFSSSNAYMDYGYRAYGLSVRCLKDAAAGGVGSLNSIDCTNPTNSGTLTSGTAASGATTAIAYTGGNGGTFTAQTITSTGVTGLTANLTAGTLAMGNGTLSFTISGTPASSGTASFALTIGGQSCTFTRTVNLPAAILSSLACATATHSGTLTSGAAASGVTTSIAYTGGNGGTYTAQTITSTGVTGLTATLTAGTLATGNGTLTFTITGTPASSGTASFALTIGGQSCTFTRTVAAPQPAYPTGTVHCIGTPTAVVEVTNPVTGRIWMDRNLGASRAATSSTDTAAYGDLYQWGRRADGHQCRTSGTTTTLSSTDQPSHGNFIFPQNSPWDWRSPQSNLWQGVNGVNNPCPTGFRLPTETEINSERTNWSENTSIGAFASPLKLPMPGARSFFSGSLSDLGIGGKYWSSTVFSTLARYLRFTSSSDSSMDSFNRAVGFSIRCIKD